MDEADTDYSDVLRVAVRFNQLVDDLVEANADPDATTLEKGATQLSMMVRFVEDATERRIAATLQPARDLFEALYDRTQSGVRSPLLWNALVKHSRNQAHHITRAHLAAALDWLFASGMSATAARNWWGKRDEYARVHKWREEAMGRTASPLTIYVFEQLRPHRQGPVTEADAKAKALELRAIAKDRRTGPAVTIFPKQRRPFGKKR